MKLAIVHADAVTGALTADEQAICARLVGRRQDEWRRGRLAARTLVGDASVVADADGAPRVAGQHISIAHDGAWIAVAVAAAPIGIDLCLRAHAARVANILAWLGVATTASPVATWAALEAVLKLRRLGIEALRDRALCVDGATVCGLGADVDVAIHDHADFVVATCGS